MSSPFVEIHTLFSLPVGNPNRGEDGRPKSATVGGVPRLRLSSQAIKRAIRISPAFAEALDGALGTRTQRVGELIDEAIAETVTDAAERLAIVAAVAAGFGKLDAKRLKEGVVRNAALVFVTPKEIDNAIAVARAMADGEALPDGKLAASLFERSDASAVDLALFGRMLADPDASPFAREAAAQVSHPITVHRMVAESDFYAAIDDRAVEPGETVAANIGERAFGGGVFYGYHCIDRRLLVANLDGDEALAARAIAAYTTAAATTTPSGHKSSFAHRTVAAHVLVTRTRSPVNLSLAYTRPVRGESMLDGALDTLEAWRTTMYDSFANAPEAEAHTSLVRPAGAVPLEALARFASGEDAG